MPARQPKYTALRLTTQEAQQQNPAVSNAAHWDYANWGDAAALVRAPLRRTLAVLNQSAQTRPFATYLRGRKVDMKVNTDLLFRSAATDPAPADEPCPGGKVCVNLVCQPDGQGGETCTMTIICN